MGAVSAVVMLTGLKAPYAEKAEGRVLPPGLIRPPGAAPEKKFLSLCVRCGECMAACPTNTLQPIWLTAGFIGLFSPAITPREPIAIRNATVAARRAPPAPSTISLLQNGYGRKPERLLFSGRNAWPGNTRKAVWSATRCVHLTPSILSRSPGLKSPFRMLSKISVLGAVIAKMHVPSEMKPLFLSHPWGNSGWQRGDYETEAKARGLDLKLRPKTVSGYPAQEPEAPDGDGLPPGFDAG